MILKSLYLKNFRIFSKESIEFPDGLTGVIGLNGVGKSTIFEAIAWVLYGSVAAKTATEHIKYIHASPSDRCRVELIFEFENNTYQVIREFKGKSLTASAEVSMNQQLVATGAGPVSTYTQNTLGLDFKSFFTSIFAKQKELNALSSMNPSERRPLILRMLGIDSLDEVIKLINEDRRSRKSLIDHLHHQLVDASGYEKKEKLLTTIEEKKEELKKIKGEIQSLKKQSNDTKEDLASLQKKLEEKRVQCEKIDAKYDHLNQLKNQYADRQKIAAEMKKITRKIKNRTQDIDEKKAQLHSCEKQIIDIDSVKVSIETIQQTIKEMDKKTEQLRTRIDEKNKSKEQTRLKQDRILAVGPKAACPTCERVLGNQHDFLIKKYASQAEIHQKEIESFTTSLEKVRQTSELETKKLTALRKKLDFLQGIQRIKDQVMTTLQTLNTELAREEEELKEKNDQLELIGSVDFDTKTYKDCIVERKNLYQDHTRITKEIAEKKDQLSKQLLKLEKTQGILKLTRKDKQSIQEKMKEIRQIEQTISNERKEHHLLEALKEIMTAFRTSLISRIRPALASYATDFFHDLTDGRYQGIMLDEQYNLHIIDEGNSYPIERFSGGEIDLANLCLRLAISEIITERAGGLFNLIILDEIFGSQDSIRQQNIITALNKLSSKFRQIFLITHVEELKHTMQSVIYVEKDQVTSTIRVV